MYAAIKLAIYTYEFNPSMPVNERITSLKIGQEAVVPNEIYTMVTNDFIAAGGDGYTMFDGKPFLGEGGLLSDILIAYIEEKKTVNPLLEGRITARDTLTNLEINPNFSIDYKDYIVKSGDWLSKIGKKYGVDWRVLTEYNSLRNPNLIFPNQVIRIPQ